MFKFNRHKSQEKKTPHDDKQEAFSRLNGQTTRTCNDNKYILYFSAILFIYLFIIIIIAFILQVQIIIFLHFICSRTGNYKSNFKFRFSTILTPEINFVCCSSSRVLLIKGVTWSTNAHWLVNLAPTANRVRLLSEVW